MDATTDTNQSLIQADVLLALSKHLTISAASDQTAADRDITHLQALQSVLRDAAPAEVCTAWQAWLDALSQTNAMQMHTERLRLFETAMPCPVHQCAYIRRDKGAILADISGFYHAFGFELSATHLDRPDHLACQLQFVALLLVMQHQAAIRQHAEQHDVVQQALHTFVQDHICPWLASFGHQLQQTTEQPAMAQLAICLMHVWQWLTQTHGWPPLDTQMLTPKLAAPDQTPYPCDGAAAPRTVALTTSVPHSRHGANPPDVPT